MQQQIFREQVLSEIVKDIIIYLFKTGNQILLLYHNPTLSQMPLSENFKRLSLCSLLEGTLVLVQFLLQVLSYYRAHQLIQNCFANTHLPISLAQRPTLQITWFFYYCFVPGYAPQWLSHKLPFLRVNHKNIGRPTLPFFHDPICSSMAYQKALAN